MSMGRRPQQAELFVAPADLPRSSGHAGYDRLHPDVHPGAEAEAAEVGRQAGGVVGNPANAPGAAGAFVGPFHRLWEPLATLLGRPDGWTGRLSSPAFA